MKSYRHFPHVLFLIGVLWGQDSHSQDYNRWSLPEGALVRLGKGSISGSEKSIAYSPDGKLLAVVSSLGVWIYDAHTGAEVNLLPSRLCGPVAFSPDWTTLACGDSWEDKVSLWDVASGQLKATLEGRAVYVSSLAFSPDGATLAVISRTPGWDHVGVWDVASGVKTVTMTPHRLIVGSLAFAPDGATLALGGYIDSRPQDRDRGKDQALQLWDVTSGRHQATLGHFRNVKSLAFSPDGTILAIGKYGEVVLWDMTQNQVKDSLPNLKGDWEVPVCVPNPPNYCTPPVYSVAFSPVGDILAFGSDHYTVALWDVHGEGQPLSLLNHTASVYSVAFSPDGARVASAGGDGQVRVWDIASGRVQFTLEHSDYRFDAVVFSPDGATVSGASTYSRGAHGYYARVRVWDVTSGRIQGTFAGLGLEPEAGFPKILALSPDGATLATLAPKAVQLWDVASGQLRGTLNPDVGRVRSLAFSPDQSTLAIGGSRADGSPEVTLQVWDAGSGEVKSLPGAGPVVREVVFSPDGGTLASTGSDVQLWDVASGQLKANLKGHRLGARSLAFSPDGAVLASGGRSRSTSPVEASVLLWDVASGRLMATLDDHKTQVQSLLFSPDGTLLVSGGGGLRLWDVASGQLRGTLNGVGATAFSPDGAILASSSSTNLGSIILWDMTPYIRSSTPTGVEFSPVLPHKQSTLLPNRPNPFNDRTQIAYRLATPGLVRLKIYNLLGQPVHTLVDQFQTTGLYQVSWDARNLMGAPISTGVYLARLIYPGGEQTRRLLYLK